MSERRCVAPVRRLQSCVLRQPSCSAYHSREDHEIRGEGKVPTYLPASVGSWLFGMDRQDGVSDDNCVGELASSRPSLVYPTWAH